MKLFIAEKPSMARSIAKNLPGPHSNKDGYIETGGGYVSWCIGHLLETSPPDAYDPKYEKFPGSFNDLPIIPSQWKQQVAKDKEKQVRVVKDLLKKCSEIVNAGDPGREGQLIVDELLDFLNNRKPVKRILLNALDDTSIQRELSNLFDNTQFAPLYQAGLGRQRADWLIGMNMSRAYTILGSGTGYRGVLSVGRVQSPTLAIVVRRDREIESFIPIDYWTIKARFETDTDNVKSQFWTSWLPPGLSTATTDNDDDDNDEAEADVAAATANRPNWLDEKNRISDPIKANEIVAKILNKIGAVIEAERRRVQEPPPLPFDLSVMQIMANSKWSASIKDTLDACQSLYEKGYTTYPRTDCSFLPETQHQDASTILQTIATAFPARKAQVDAADPAIKSRAWNDKKLGEHHAIIPTRQAPDMGKLSTLEAKVYEAVALRYLAQFYPPAEVDKAKIIVEVENEHFMARGRTIVKPSWRVIYDNDDINSDEPSEKSEDPSDSKSEAILPSLNQGDPALCLEAKADAKKTSPPARYTQGTLLDAMKKVHTLVSDPAIKKKLRSVEGIGRSATRAAIIDTLLRRAFLDAKGKQISSSQVGKALIDALPPKLIDPALTAMWETALDAVASGKAPLEMFMAKQSDWIIKLIEAAKIAKIENLPQSPPYQPRQPYTAGKSPGKGPAAKSAAKIKGAKTCPKCKKGQMVERKAKTGPNAGNSFLGCTNYPECKHSESTK